MGVLEQRTGTHGDRRLHGIEEREEVGYQRVGQLSTEEVLQDDLVRSVAEGDGIEIVLLHELVEEVGAKHDGLRYRHLGTLILVQLGVALDNAVEEGQAAALAAERALADAGKVGIAVELQSVEDGHHADVLHAAVLHDGVEDNLPVGIDILQLVPRDVLQEGRHGEDGAGREPAAHVVAHDVVAERVGGNLEDIVLQVLQRGDAGNLLVGVRVAEDEVAEAHVLLHQVVQVDVHLRRVLVNEVEALGLCLLAVDALLRVENQRHVLVALPDFAQQL